MKRPRDSQRSKLYRAECVIEIGDRVFLLNSDCQDYADHVTQSPAWKKLCREHKISRPGITVLPARENSGRARAWGRYVTIPYGQRRASTLLHELAHCCTPRIYAAHGREFARAFLLLVRQEMGADAATALATSYRKHGVRYRKRSTRQVSDEEKQRLRERLAAVRERAAAKARP